MKKILFKILAPSLLLACIQFTSYGQSAALYGGGTSGKAITLGGIDADGADTLYIGAGTHNIDGTWEIYSTYVIVDPNARISGAGSIVFYNPSLGFGASVPSILDANNNADSVWGVNVVLQNGNGLNLSNLSFPADFAAAGWTESSTSSSLYTANDIDLATDGANIVLDNTLVGDLHFTGTGTISNYRPTRMVVTNNSILSHVVKDSYTSSFVFPVGIAAGDYTPASISNASSNTVSVSVQDYANSASPEALADGSLNLADGMNRTWHIFGANSGISSTLNLQHNSTTNQSGFVDAGHFITQWGTSTPNTTGDFTIAYSMSSWQTNTQGLGAIGNLSSTGSVLGTSMRSRTYSAGLATLSSANESFFTKSTDMEHPLPINLLNFTAKPNGCKVLLQFRTGEEANLAAYNVQQSSDGITYHSIAKLQPKGSNSEYNFEHTNATNGRNLYRLELIEQNAHKTYSSTIVTSVNCGQEVVVLAYPNPTNGLLTISGMSGNATEIVLLNLQGQLIQRLSTDSKSTSLDLSELPSASYLLRVVEKGAVLLNEKLIKN